MPEIDFLESPLGFIYVAPRRIMDNIWLRVTDVMLPNLVQINRNEEDGQTEHPFWPGATTEWFVPVDDTHSVTFSFKRVPEDVPDPPRTWGELADWDDPYEERQRYPSDGSAIVTQRSIAVHDLEHLADTDRGVIMLRRKFAEIIRAVQRGDDPPAYPQKGGIIQTYTSDTVQCIPAAPAPDDDKKLLRKTGLEWASEYLRDHPPFMGVAPYTPRKRVRVPQTPKSAYFTFLSS
jgi:hypothetical protein